jgi:hypothetical protein
MARSHSRFALRGDQETPAHSLRRAAGSLTEMLVAFIAAPHGRKDRWLTCRNRSDRHSQGMATRRPCSATPCRPRRFRARPAASIAPFQELITEAAWGHVWSRPTGRSASARW